MARKVSRKEIDSTRYLDFLKVSRNFAEGAIIASEYEYYNAAGVLIIHAAIALADAITIRFASVKCSGENHYEVVKLISETAPRNSQTKSAINHFEKLIDHKNAVSYHGEVYEKEDFGQLNKHFIRFSIWANSIL